MPKLKEKDASCQRVRTEDAAKEIGCHRQYMLNKMASGQWDLGKVVYKKKTGGKNEYFIFRAKLDKFLAKELANKDGEIKSGELVTERRET